MKEWKSYKLGEISTIQTGPFGSQLHQSDYVESGVPCIMPTNIGRMLDFQVAGIAHISEGDALKLSRHIVHEGDIVYSRRGDIEKCAYVSQEQDGWFCGTGCLKITINSNLAVPKFVAYYLSTDEIKSWIVGNAVGTTMLNLNTSVLADVPLSLPSIQMQKRCVQILDSIENKIALNNRINHNLEEQAQARFDSMIMSDIGLGYCQIADYVDVNPKRSLGKNVFAKCIDMSFLSTTGPFPSGWETKGYNGGMKFLNGDTIMARITPCLENGKVAFVNFLEDGEVAFGSTEYIVLHAKDGVAPVFTYFLARNKDFVDYATKNINGSSGRQRVSGDTIEKYKIPVIDSPSLDEFSSFAAPAMEVIRNNCFESRSLASTRDALLPLLLSENPQLRK